MICLKEGIHLVTFGWKDVKSQIPGWVFLEINRWCGKSIGAKNRWNMAEILWTMSWILKYLGYFIANDIFMSFSLTFFNLCGWQFFGWENLRHLVHQGNLELFTFLLDALPTLLLFFGAPLLRCSKEDARTSSHVDDTKSFESPMALWKPWSQPGLFENSLQ